MLKEIPVVIDADMDISSRYNLKSVPLSTDEIKFASYEDLKSKFVDKEFVTDIIFLKENIRNDKQSIDLVFLMSEENYTKIEETLQKNKEQWDKYVKSYTENTNGYISLCSEEDFANPIADDIFNTTVKFLKNNYYYDKIE